MTDNRKSQRPLVRWRERRRAKRQEALEREHFKNERLDPSTRAFVDGEHSARFNSWTSGGM
jgi:hypothetical protein